jgi:hypothetical protein
VGIPKLPWVASNLGLVSRRKRRNSLKPDRTKLFSLKSEE